MADPEVSYECLRAAGADPDVIHAARLLIAGGGNAGANATLSLAVLGIETAYVDPDRVEAKNVAHSPFLKVSPLSDEAGAPLKAELLAWNHVEQSRRVGQVAHFAALPIQAVPFGALRRFAGIVVGIDDGPSRAWAARAGAFLGIPTIVVGFHPPGGNFIATTNKDPKAPCYFCLREEESLTRASCSLYSDDPQEIHPALQTAAGATMNVAIEAMVRFWHGDVRYDGQVFRLDLGDGTASRTGFLPNPNCSGPHDRIPPVVSAAFAPSAAVADVLELARRDGLRHPVLELPSPFVVSLPCRLCGSAVTIGQPDWAVRQAPACPDGCGPRRPTKRVHVESRIDDDNPLSSRTLGEVGLGPLSWCVVADECGDDVKVYELPGSWADVFVSVAR